MNNAMFVEPNFRCKIRPKGKADAKWMGRLVYAKSEAEARAFLDGKGFEIHSVKQYNFETWKKDAETAKKLVLRAKKAGKKPEFKASLWSVLKEHLQDLFYEKCAYCEALFLHVEFGDVEHYRPKAGVTGEPKHDGYYWLAYAPDNYLPSCQRCNQAAKKNHFPISGKRAFGPSDSLNDENPLLMNPYTDDPLKYVKFASSHDKNPGWVMPVDDKGKESIKSYDLNRDTLIRVRKEEQEHIRLRLKSLLSDENPRGLNELIRDCQFGRRQFSSAATAEIENYYRTMGFASPFSTNGEDAKSAAMAAG
jgi:hypothetical protein